MSAIRGKNDCDDRMQGWIWLEEEVYGWWVKQALLNCHLFLLKILQDDSFLFVDLTGEKTSELGSENQPDKNLEQKSKQANLTTGLIRLGILQQAVYTTTFSNENAIRFGHSSTRKWRLSKLLKTGLKVEVFESTSPTHWPGMHVTAFLSILLHPCKFRSIW